MPPNKNQSLPALGFSKPSLREFWLSLSGKRWFKPLAGLAVLALAAYFAWLLFVPAAVIDGKKISKLEHRSLTDKLKKFASYAEQEGVSDPSVDAMNFLIEEIALAKAAGEHGVSVTEEEINAAYKELASQYPSEEAFLETIATAYGWDKDLTLRSQKIKLLKQKLEDRLIRSRSVLGTFVRWDVDFGDAPQEEWDAIAKAKFETDLLPLLDRSVPTEEIESAVANLQADPLWASPRLGTVTYSGLNELTASGTNTFSDANEWVEIKKLEQVGDQTPLYRAEGGYYVVYRLTAFSNGEYDSWEDWLAAVKSDKANKINSLNYRLGSTKLAVRGHLAKAGHSIARLAKSAAFSAKSLFVEPVYSTHNGNCTYQHFSRAYGVTYDGVSGQRLAYVNITGTRTDIGAANDPCHPKASYTVQSSNGNMFDNSGTLMSQIGMFRLGNHLNGQAGDTNGLSCFRKWDITVAKSGYNTNFWDNADLKPNGTNVKLDSVAADNYSGDYRTENFRGDFDGDVYLKPIPKPATLNVISQPAQGAKVTASGYYTTVSGTAGTTNWSMRNNNGAITNNQLTFTQAPGGYTFSSWSGCDPGSSGTTCIVSVTEGNTRTVTANLTPTGGTTPALGCDPQSTSLVTSSMPVTQVFRAFPTGSGTYNWSLTWSGDGEADVLTPNNQQTFEVRFKKYANYAITVNSPGSNPTSRTCYFFISPPAPVEPEGTVPPGDIQFNQQERPPFD